MSKIKTILKGGVLAAFLTVVVAAPTFAADCAVGDQHGEFEGLSLVNVGSPAPANHSTRCMTMSIEDASGVMKPTFDIYGKNSAACAKAGSLASNPDGCQPATINSTIQLIVNMIVFAVGLVAVIMVILGGVQYSTSQGDSGKVKKAKDTIMYGIIGLVVAILAFAIVNFVLSGITG